jgi:hypothetical protein
MATVEIVFFNVLRGLAALNTAVSRLFVPHAKAVGRSFLMADHSSGRTTRLCGRHDYERAFDEYERLGV